MSYKIVVCGVCQTAPPEQVPLLVFEKHLVHAGPHQRLRREHKLKGSVSARNSLAYG